jgi:phosphoribosylformylglycinamidine synthase
MERIVQSRKLEHAPFDSFESVEARFAAAEVLSDQILLTKTVETVLKVPAVGSKSFLLTIGDRTVGGMTTRDQMVGPWQTPVADVAVTATALSIGGASKMTGEAICMGEKPPIALISPAASARMAVAESLLNLAAADIQDGLSRVHLSANWMVAINEPGEGAALNEAVQAISMEMCPRLGISIPVGKDSTSMKVS